MAEKDEALDAGLAKRKVDEASIRAAIEAAVRAIPEFG